MKKLLLFFMSLFSFLTFGQISEGFEGASFPPAGWTTFENGIGTARQWTTTTATGLGWVYAGAKSAIINKEDVPSGIAEDWMVTPLVTIPTNGQLRFYARSISAGEQGSVYKVKLSTVSQNNPADFTTTLATYSELDITNTGFDQKTILLNAYAGQNVYIAFVMENDNGDAWIIDNISVNEQCFAPTALVAAPFSTSANLSWTYAGPATQFEIEYGPAGFVQGTGTIVTPVSNPHTLTGLTPLTNYSYYVRALCGTDNISPWSTSINFTTTAAPPVCGGNFVDNGGVAANYTNNADDTITIFPTNPGDLVTVTFTSFNTEPSWDALYVFDGNSVAAPQIASANGAGNVPGGLAGGYWGTTIPGPFTSSAADGSLTFRFRSDGSGTRTGWTANVTCAPAPTCPKPSNFVTSNPTSTTIDLAWTDNAGASSWVVEYGPAGFTPGTGTSVNVNTNPYTLTGLTAGTIYNVYVNAVCSPTDSSALTGPKVFNTLLCNPAQQCLYSFVLTDSFGDGWNGNTMNVSQNGVVVAVLGPTFTTGGGPVTIQVPLCDGLPFQLFWNAGGSFASEVGVEIIDPFASSIFTKAPNTGTQNSLLYTGTAFCTPPSCPKPTALVVSLLTSSSASLAWTNNAPSAAQWEVIVLPAGSPAPTAASVGTVTSSNPFAITGLTSQTAYDVYVRAICVAGVDLSEWSVKASFSTLPDYCGGDHFYDNGGATANYTNSADNTITIYPTNPGDLVTVIFNSFNTEANWDALYVYDGNSIAAPQLASANGAGNVPGGVTGGYWGTTIPGPFTSSAADGSLTFRFRSDGSGTRAGWDATVLCTPPPTCPRPNTLIATAVTATSATLSWIETGTATNWEILVLPFGSPIPTPTSLGIATSNPFLVTGLNPGSAYTFYVRAVCDPTDSSFWSNGYNFSTTPVNDECSTAIVAPVNTNLECIQSISGTIAGATSSSQASTCTGGLDDDVWFQFTALTDTHTIALSNMTPATGMAFGVYTGADCNSLTEVTCVNAADGTVENLLAGQVYYIRVYSTGTTPQTTTFDLCITTVPCAEAVSFCSSQPLTFPNSVDIEDLGSFDCLGSSPNATFFFLHVGQAGQLDYLMTQSTTPGGGPDLDVDYAIWGPFTDNIAACNAIPNNSPVDCSYSAAPTENFSINAQLCEIYVLMITNFANDAGYITLTQTNIATGGQTICYPFNTFNYSANTYCQNDANQLPTLVAGATGGTYTASPNGLIIDSITGEINVAASAPGVYTVTSTIIPTTGGVCPNVPNVVTTRTVIITENPVATIAYNNAQYCNNDTTSALVNLTGTSGGTYSASPAGLFIDAVNGSIIPGISLPGVYTVSYDIPATGGCPSLNTTTQVEILAVPVIPIQANVSACNTYTLQPLTVGNYYTGTGATGTMLNAGDQISSSQTIYIYAVNGICSSERSFDVTIESVPTPTISVTVQPTCAVPTATIDVTSPLSATDYEYSLDGGPYQTSVTFTGLIPGAHNLIAHNLITDCYSVALDFTINAVPFTNPVTDFSYTLPICINGTINPVPNTSAVGFVSGGIYSSTAGLSIDASTGEIFLSASMPGSYVVQYSVPVDNANCVNAGQSTFTVVLSDITDSFITNGCQGNNYVVAVNPLNNSYNPTQVSYEWTTSSGSVIGTSQNVIVANTGTYNVTVTTADGCEETLSITLNEVSCIVPKGISPNGDGKNDSFDLTWLNVRGLSIFNRYGKEVYSNVNYSNQWVGQSNNGNELPDGTYYYVITLDDSNTMTGWIYINRQR